MAAIRLGRRLPGGSSGLTRGHRAGHPSPYSALLQVGFTEHPPSPAGLVSSYLTVSPLPAPLGRGRFAFCCTFPASRRAAVSGHPALWSPDFPPAPARGASDCPAGSGLGQNNQPCKLSPGASKTPTGPDHRRVDNSLPSEPFLSGAGTTRQDTTSLPDHSRATSTTAWSRTEHLPAIEFGASCWRNNCDGRQRPVLPAASLVKLGSWSLVDPMVTDPKDEGIEAKTSEGVAQTGGPYAVTAWRHSWDTRAETTTRGRRECAGSSGTHGSRRSRESRSPSAEGSACGSRCMLRRRPRRRHGRCGA